MGIHFVLIFHHQAYGVIMRHVGSILSSLVGFAYRPVSSPVFFAAIILSLHSPLLASIQAQAISSQSSWYCRGGRLPRPATSQEVLFAEVPVLLGLGPFALGVPSPSFLWQSCASLTSRGICCQAALLTGALEGRVLGHLWLLPTELIGTGMDSGILTSL